MLPHNVFLSSPAVYVIIQGKQPQLLHAGVAKKSQDYLLAFKHYKVNCIACMKNVTEIFLNYFPFTPNRKEIASKNFKFRAGGPDLSTAH